LAPDASKFPPKTQRHIHIRKNNAKNQVEVFRQEVMVLIPNKKQLEEILVFRCIIIPPYISIKVGAAERVKEVSYLIVPTSQQNE